MKELISLTPAYIGFLLKTYAIFLFFSRTHAYFLQCPKNFPGSGRKTKRKGWKEPCFHPLNYQPPLGSLPHGYKATSATPGSRGCIKNHTPGGIRKHIYQLRFPSENLARFTDLGFAHYFTTTLRSRMTPQVVGRKADVFFHKTLQETCWLLVSCYSPVLSTPNKVSLILLYIMEAGFQKGIGLLLIAS